MGLFGLDVAILAAAFSLAYLFRFDLAIPMNYQAAFLNQLPLVLIVQLMAVFAAGIPLVPWRYVGIREVRALASAAAYAAVPLLVLRAVLPEGLSHLRVPVSIILADTLLAFGGLLAARMLCRMAHERAEVAKKAAEFAPRDRRVVLFGAGRTGIMAVREIHGRADVGLHVAGFVDDDPLKQGMVISGVPVLGLARDLPRLAAELDLDRAVMTIAAPTPGQIREFEVLCDRAGVSARTIPGFYEVLQGKVRIDRFRKILPEQLLGRDPVSLDQRHMRASLHGKRVMVTGAGGSIGSELSRQIADLEPAELILLERAEFALFAIDREVRHEHPRLAVSSKEVVHGSS